MRRMGRHENIRLQHMEGTKMTDYQSIAASLYDGGWRKDDTDWIALEYNFSQVDAAKICEYLGEMECKYDSNS